MHGRGRQLVVEPGRVEVHPRARAAHALGAGNGEVVRPDGGDLDAEVRGRHRLLARCHQQAAGVVRVGPDKAHGTSRVIDEPVDDDVAACAARDGDLGTDRTAVRAAGNARLVGARDGDAVDGRAQVVGVLDRDCAQDDVEVGAVGNEDVRDHVLVVDLARRHGDRAADAVEGLRDVERALERVGDRAKRDRTALAVLDSIDLAVGVALATQAGGADDGRVHVTRDVNHDAGRRVAHVVGVVRAKLDGSVDVIAVGVLRVLVDGRQERRLVAASIGLIAQAVGGVHVDVGAIDGGRVHVDRGREGRVAGQVGLGGDVAHRVDGAVGLRVDVVARGALALAGHLGA